MKTLALVFTLALSTNAFSKHNYYQENCSFESIKGEVHLYKRNYWEGSHMLITSDFPGIDPYNEVWMPGSEASDDDHIRGDEAMVFTDVKDGVVIKRPYNDGCWQGFTKTFERTVRVEIANQKIQEILHIYSGDELTMKCGYEHLEVLGDTCDSL
jgi:hypothetical protein